MQEGSCRCKKMVAGAGLVAAGVGKECVAAFKMVLG